MTLQRPQPQQKTMSRHILKQNLFKMNLVSAGERYLQWRKVIVIQLINMKINLPILYKQGDSRWAYKKLGFNSDPQYNFKDYGCLDTALAMVARYFGKQVDPSELNDKLMALGANKGFAAGSGNYIYGAITKIYSDIKENKIVTPMPLTDEQLGEIRTAIDNGYPVIIQLDYNPKTVALDSHFVIIVDYNKKDENDFTIVDPITGATRSLKDYLGWYKPSVRKTVEKYLIMTGPKPEFSSDTMPVDKKVFADLVHGSTEWDKTVAEYVPEANPKQTGFEEVQRVVNGYKSDASAAKKKLSNTESELEIAKTEIENQKDKLANTEAKCQRAIELKNAEIQALKDTQPNTETLKKQYEGTIKALENDLREVQKQGGIKDIEIAKLKSELENSAENQKAGNAFEIIIRFIKNIWSK